MEARPDFRQLAGKGFQQLWFVIVLEKGKAQFLKRCQNQWKITICFKKNRLSLNLQLGTPPLWLPSDWHAPWTIHVKKKWPENKLLSTLKTLNLTQNVRESMMIKKLKNMYSRIWSWMCTSWSVVDLNISYTDMCKIIEHFARSCDMETTPVYATTCGCLFVLLYYYEFSRCYCLGCINPQYFEITLPSKRSDNKISMCVSVPPPPIPAHFFPFIGRAILKLMHKFIKLTLATALLPNMLVSSSKKE